MGWPLFFVMECIEVSLVKSQGSWSLVYGNESYRVAKADNSIFDKLGISDSTKVYFADSYDDRAVGYIVKNPNRINIYINGEIELTSNYNIGFFKFLESGVKYYMLLEC